MKTAGGKKTKLLTVRLEPQTYDNLKELSKNAGLSISQIIRMFLNRKQVKVIQPPRVEVTKEQLAFLSYADRLVKAIEKALEGDKLTATQQAVILDSLSDVKEVLDNILNQMSERRVV